MRKARVATASLLADMTEPSIDAFGVRNLQADLWSLSTLVLT